MIQVVSSVRSQLAVSNPQHICAFLGQQCVFASRFGVPPLVENLSSYPLVCDVTTPVSQDLVLIHRDEHPI